MGDEPFSLINIDEYEFEDNIGRGTYGTVFLVRNKINNKLYAAKQSLQIFDKEKKKLDSQTEINAYSKIKGPSILKVYGYSMENFSKRPYQVIICEYMVNGSLDKYLGYEKNKVKKLTMTQKYIICLGIALGMKEAHQNGIVHRDLKPGNILLDENYYPYICDFGESKQSDLDLSQILMTSEVGTPLYMAPEVIEDESYNFKVDIFSFSFILYQLFTDAPLFPKRMLPVQISMKISEGVRPDLSLIESEMLQSFLEQCWNQDPLNRPSFSDIVEVFLKDEMIDLFKADKESVKEYLSLFDKELMNKKNANKQEANNKCQADQGGTTMDKDMGEKHIQMAEEVGNQGAPEGISLSKSDPSQSKIVEGDFSPEEFLNKILDLPKFAVEMRRITSPVILQMTESLKIGKVDKHDESLADLIIYDGIFSIEKYQNFNPSVHLNKIPGMNKICKKDVFFNSINEMKHKFPDAYNSNFPVTFLIPNDMDAFIIHTKSLDLTAEPWVKKNAKTSNGNVKLIVDPNKIQMSNSIVQPFIRPYIIEGHKVDLRLYFVITNLKPLTVYMYKEGIAYFCLELYDAAKLEDEPSIFFDKKAAIKESNFKFARPASKIIQTISRDVYGDDGKILWAKIERISALSTASIFKSMRNSAKMACEKNDESSISKKNPIAYAHRFFHLVGIDITFDDKGNPFVLGINDNPSLKGLNSIDSTLKTDLIKEDFKLMSALIKEKNIQFNNWNQILPSNENDVKEIVHSIVDEMDHENSLKESNE